MNISTLTTILNMILAIIPQLTSSKAINNIVTWLVQIEPTLVQFYNEIGPVITNIVAALSANPATTADQLAALKIIDAKVDAAFDDAVAAYLANHAAKAAPTA